MSSATLKTTFLILLHFMDTMFVHAKPNIVRMPEQCRGKNYCMVKSKDYPQSAIEKLLADLRVKTVDPDSRLSHRLGGDETENICEREYQVDPIYEIIDTSGDVRYVAQLQDMFMQRHEIVECKNPGRVENSNGSGLFQDYQLQQFNVSCVETRLEIQLLVLRHDRQGVELASPLGGISASCSCRYSDPTE